MEAVKHTLGDTVTLIKATWAGNGSAAHPFHKADVSGVITSVRGMEGHTNKHMYEITTQGCTYYTNNNPKEGSGIANILFRE